MNARSAQLIAIVLAFLLMLLILVTLFVLLNRPFSPSPSASPTGVAVLSPSPLPSLPGETPTLAPGVTPSPEPTLGPILTPTLLPSLEPSAVPSPTVSPSPTPSPTPVPTVNPSTAQRELRLLSVGLDSRLAEGWIERIVTFTVEGQSLVEARVSEASASGVRICLWREAVNDERECRSGRNMVLTRAVLDAGSTVWHVSLVGPREQVSPHVNLTLRFNASQPSVELDRFRFVGTSAPDYNGFLAQFGTGGQGAIRVIATFDDGQAGEYPFHLIIGPASGTPTFDQTSGEVTGFDFSHTINGAGDRRVELRNPDEFAAGGLLPVFVHVELRWP